MTGLTNIVLALAVLSSVPAMGATRAQVERFTKWLDMLEAPLKAETPEKAADALLELEDSRFATFQLQALGRVYNKYDKEFEKFRKHFQMLEDSLGDIDQASKIGTKAEQLQAKAALVQLLKDEEWSVEGESPRIQKFHAKLSKIAWPDDQEDKEFVVDRIKKQLKSLNSTNYDMTVLQKGNGLHELRRELRWFLLETQSVAGLIRFKNSQSCPIDAFADLLNDKNISKKYSQLPENRALKVSPCHISRCLYVAVADVVKKLGDIKDAGELYAKKHGGTDKVPATLLKEAQAQYTRVKSTNLLPTLIEEVKACEK